MTKYTEFKEENNKALNEFISKYFVFAFGQQQYENKLKELGLTDEEFQAKYVGFLGGAIPADKVDEYLKLSKQTSNSLRNKIFSDFEFAKDAFNYEMSNYECYYSYRFDEVLGALGISGKDLNEHPDTMRAYKEAKREYWDWCNENC